MGYKIAFASSDGKVVNEHFGKAQKFHIVEINENDYKFIESRDNIPSCNEFEHSENSLINSIKVIEDCKAVFVARIGPGAKQAVEDNNIQAIEAPYFIEDILDKLLHSKVKLIYEKGGDNYD